MLGGGASFYLISFYITTIFVVSFSLVFFIFCFKRNNILAILFLFYLKYFPLGGIIETSRYK